MSIATSSHPPATATSGVATALAAHQPSALVFGASGQIGQVLCRRLVVAGWQVEAVSRKAQPAQPGIGWHQCDLGASRGDDVPGQVDVIFSCGPLDAFARWYAAADRVTAARVVAFGSTSVLFKQASANAYERDVAARLHAGEQTVMATAGARGAAATLLRPTLVYGAGSDRTLSQIAAIAVRTGVFVLPRDAVGLRQPVHVEDLADAAFAAAQVHSDGGHCYALAGGETLRYDEMIARALAVLPRRPRLLRVPRPLFTGLLALAHGCGRMRSVNAEVVARMRQDLCFDIEPARRDLGYRPRTFAPTAEMLGVGGATLGGAVAQ